MPRYFLHCFDTSSSFFDDIGRELIDDEAAREHAIWCARDIVANSLLVGYELDLKGYLSVQDLNGKEYCRVCFRDVSSKLRVGQRSDGECADCGDANPHPPVARTRSDQLFRRYSLSRIGVILSLSLLLWAAILLIALRLI